MVRWLSAVALLLVGFFGLTLAILLPTVVVPASKKTPLDLNITLRSSGSATVLDAATGKERTVQLRATRIVRSDSQASDSQNTTMNESLCIVIVQGSTPDCVRAPDPRLLSVTTDRVTTNRKSAEAVHVARWNENVNGDTSVRHVGLAYKWPIDAQKKTYLFFNPDVNKAIPATYAGESSINGLTVYKFVSKTGVLPYKILGTLSGTYDDTRTVWIEPSTGAIIDGVEHQVQKLENGQVALDTVLSFDKSAIDSQTSFAKSKINDLRLAQIWMPLIAGVLGIAAIVGGILLARPRRGTKGPQDGDGDHGERPPTPDGGPGEAAQAPSPDGAPRRGFPGYEEERVGSSQT